MYFTAACALVEEVFPTYCPGVTTGGEMQSPQLESKQQGKSDHFDWSPTLIIIKKKTALDS